MTMNQSQENPNGCSGQKENEDEGISFILEELGTYICDKICLRDTRLTQEEQDQHCAGCRLKNYIDRIGQEYDRINTFGKTSAYQIMKKYRNIVLCEECIYRSHEASMNIDRCRLSNALSGFWGNGDGCSSGKRKE